MLKELYPQRKRTRLEQSLYADVSSICSVTICTRSRAPVFQHRAFAAGCIDLLVSHAKNGEVRLHAYCLMPDHLHLLISPSEQESIIDFVREFKAISTRMSWQHGFNGTIWQQGFHDHFLRRDEDVELAERYILGNPVRKGMVQNRHAYPYCGSPVYDL